MDKIHGLTPLKKVHFLVLVKTSIFWSKNDCFLSKISKKRFFLTQFLWKTAITQSSIFGQNPWTNPFGKCPFFWPFLKLHIFPLNNTLFFPQYKKRSFLLRFLLRLQFFSLKMIVFYLKYPKTIFSDIISVKNSNKRKFDFWTKSMD